MKKLVKVLALVLAVVTISVAATACSVSGKTYVFDKLEITTTQSVDQKELDLGKAFMEAMFKDFEITFNADGTVTGKMGDSGIFDIDEDDTAYWKEKGNKIFIGDKKDFEIVEKEGEYFEKSFGGLVVTAKEDELTIKIYFKTK